MTNTLKLEVTWTTGRKTDLQVTGTKHAGNLLRKNAHKIDYARLYEPLSDGTMNVRAFSHSQIVTNAHGTISSLFDRNNTHYDLTKK